ncbi:MAG: NAD(P)-dependent oxidoreductase [Deltaproteobacteria bacterium]|nr:NAD(P)-dependent oxidoreductase [Deltaproteobacteria bacterium]
MTTLVTGANGFLGKHLIRHISENFPGEHIVGIGKEDFNFPQIESLTMDLTDQAAVARTVQKFKPDRVYHLAGSARVQDDLGVPEYFAPNFLTTSMLISALGKLAQPVSLFFTSSVHVYGNQTETVTENSQVHPVSAYAFTKYLAEEALRMAIHTYPHLKVAVGRLYTCIGPDQSEGFVAADLCRRIRELSDEKSAVLNVGSLSGYRSFLDVRDAMRIFPQLLSRMAPNRFDVFNISSKNELTIAEVLEILLKISGKSPKIECHEDQFPNRFKGLRVSVKKLEDTLGTLDFRPIDSTLRDMYEGSTKRSSNGQR